MSQPRRGFLVQFEESNQEIVFSGSMRPWRASELDEAIRLMETAADSVSGTLYLNFRKLAQLNNTAFKRLSNFIRSSAEKRPKLLLKIITTSVVAWEEVKFKWLEEVNPNVKVELFDKDFYPGQSIVENEEFIPVLRAQTKMTWPHERNLLRKHGLQEEMHIGDICCGIGDFAALVRKEFKPTSITAIDHSKPSLEYARRVAREFALEDITYQYGDATALLLPDDHLDFVICRNALQVFDKPELILKELFRICKPGGIVYVTSEKKSHCFGDPGGEAIEWTYREVARLWKFFGMDIELGPKQYRMLLDVGFEQVRLERFEVTNLENDPHDFAEVVRSWERYCTEQMALRRGDTAEWLAKFRAGFQDHIRAIEQGFASWPIWVASGRKPTHAEEAAS